MANPIIGSDGWDGDAENMSDSMKRCIDDTNWGSVLKICELLRGGVGCVVGVRYSWGSQNVVKLIEFKDGVKWVIRIPLGDTESLWAASIPQRIENEVATYKYLKKHTSIPVPEIHAYSSEADPDIGCPFIIMTYLHGTTADDFDLNAEQKLHVWRQMAAIILELASHKFDHIGGLAQNSAGTFSIGKDMETNQGPFQTAGEFYIAVSRHRFQGYADAYFDSNLAAERVPGLHLPFMFQNLMPLFTGCETDTGPFSLTNTDGGFHNILLDAGRNVVGLIDCDNIIAAPIHLVAQVPRLGNIQMLPPGLETRNPVLIERYKKRQAEHDRFVELLQTVEADSGADTTISDTLKTDGACLMAGLEDYASRAWNGCDEWVRSYYYIYYRKLHGYLGESGAKVFSEAHIPQDDVMDEGTEAESNSSESVEGGVEIDGCCTTEPHTASDVDGTRLCDKSSPVASPVAVINHAL